MAKLQDKFFNRVIEGDLELESSEKAQVIDAVEKDSSLKVYENIVDAQGHKRFIEGDITQETITGITPGYSKWSLSGSHLMIVLCGTIANGTVISSGQLLMQIALPQWIMDKIFPVYGNNIEYKLFSVTNSSGQSQNIGCYTQKADGKIKVRLSALTLTDERMFRVYFDLLIDNEAPAE